MSRRRNRQDLYDDRATEWWDPRSRTFRSLRSVSEFRLALLRRWIGPRLPGSLVVDLGCGGGLLAQPLSHLGARVIGVDLSLPSLRAAHLHSRDGSWEGALEPPRFLQGDLRRVPLEDGSAGHVLLADVLEHIVELEAALEEASRLLGSRGTLYVSSINRTAKAAWWAVHMAESVGLIPRGTHDPALFVTPDELCRAAHGAGLELRELQGESLSLWPTLRKWRIHLQASSDTSVSYSALFVRR